MRTAREIQDKLALKGFGREAISIVLERLTSVGLINDAEYAGAFLRTSLKLRPKSYRSLQSELIKKGISRDIAGSAIRQSSELTPEIEIARLVMAKASRVYGKLPSAERRRKLFSFLARRGFSLGTISELLGEEGGT
jgi:regulatory protein